MLASNARSTENVADSCANDDDIVNDDGRHIFSKLEICNKRNTFFFKKLKIFIQCICWSSLLHIHL